MVAEKEKEEARQVHRREILLGSYRLQKFYLWREVNHSMNVVRLSITRNDERSCDAKINIELYNEFIEIY